MKCHISATIERDLLRQADRYGIEERRSRSRVIEMALEHFLRDRATGEEEIVTSAGRFAGKFSREDTYDR